MGNIDDPKEGPKAKALEELRSRKVGVLLQIIEELEELDLSIREIETILRTCGLNAECAVRFGHEMRHEKEKGHAPTDRPTHP